MGRSGHKVQLLCSFYGLAPPVSLLCPRPCPSAMPWWLCCISVLLPSRGCYASSSSFCLSSREFIPSLQLYKHFSEPVLAFACMLGGVWVAGGQLVPVPELRCSRRQSLHDWPLSQVWALQLREEKVVWRPLKQSTQEILINFRSLQ